MAEISVNVLFLLYFVHCMKLLCNYCGLDIICTVFIICGVNDTCSSFCC